NLLGVCVFAKEFRCGGCASSSRCAFSTRSGGGAGGCPSLIAGGGATFSGGTGAFFAARSFRFATRGFGFTTGRFAFAAVSGAFGAFFFGGGFLCFLFVCHVTAFKRLGLR